MRIGAFHSHLNGFEWLQMHRPGMWDEIQRIIESIDAESCRTKISKERTMLGRALYSPSAINARFKAEFEHAAWNEDRTQYWVTDDYEIIGRTIRMPAKEQRALIEESGRIALKSYNQTDFVKERVAVEVQLGKYAFIAYDLFVKHMAFYVGDRIDLGVEILPMKVMQAQMSSGPGYYEGALYDIARQGRGVPAVPLILVGIEPEVGPELRDLPPDVLNSSGPDS